MNTWRPRRQRSTLRGNDWQGHEKKYGSKAVAQIFTVQFLQLWSGQLVLYGPNIKGDLLWGREVNSSVNMEIRHWVKSSFLSRDTDSSAVQRGPLSKFYSLNSEPASCADGGRNPFRQGGWRLPDQTEVSGLSTWQVCMPWSCWARRTQAFPLPWSEVAVIWLVLKWATDLAWKSLSELLAQNSNVVCFWVEPHEEDVPEGSPHQMEVFLFCNREAWVICLNLRGWLMITMISQPYLLSVRFFFLRLTDKATGDFKLSPLNDLFVVITAKGQARIAQIC